MGAGRSLGAQVGQVTGGQIKVLAKHVGGPWWRCGFCGQLVKLVTV